MNKQKPYIIIALFIFVAIVFLTRIFYFQVVTDKFKKRAESLLSKKEITPAYRGLIYDRNNTLLVYNKPVYEIEAIKKNVEPKYRQQICELLDITEDEYEEKFKGRRSYLPFTFIKEISQEKYAQIQDRFDFPGFDFIPKIIRAYPHRSLANTLGYVGEISQRKLDRDTTGYYRASDLIGLTGLEKTYEKDLKGNRGIKYIKVDAKRVAVGSLYDGQLDTLPIKGKDLYTTIDLELQKYGEKLLDNKIGGIVAIDPKTGGILSMITNPTYDPNLLAGKQYSKNYAELLKDTLKPLFNRAVQASYPPGSIFKVLQTVIALGDSSTNLTEQIYCDGSLIGDHASPGYYNYHRGIMLSSNNYYVKLYYRMLDKNLHSNMYTDTKLSYDLWYKNITSFGLGSKLRTDIANESSGNVPTSKYYDKIHGKNRWYRSAIKSNAIGQGELLVTPLQMANMAAIIANKGFYYTPHFVQSIDKSKEGIERFYIKNKTTVENEEYYTKVADAMEAVVLRGTARRAITKDISVCGKTGTIENPHGEDHSCFIAFAPKENPQIAIAVYVENAGYGGTWAGPIASLMIEKYIKGEISNQRKEDRILAKNFINPITK